MSQCVGLDIRKYFYKHFTYKQINYKTFFSVETNVVFKRTVWLFFSLDCSSRCLYQKELCRDDVGNGLITIFILLQSLLFCIRGTLKAEMP